MNLGQAAKEQVYLIECTACKHKAQVDLIAMSEKFGESFQMKDLKTKLRCSRCRSKKTILTTLWRSSTATQGFVRRFLRD